MRRLLIFALVGLFGCSGARQTTDANLVSDQARAVPVAGAVEESDAAALADEDLLPMDPAVQKGRLDNGMSYLIRKNGRPENRAELRLVVNVGSILEDEDQLGLAHFVEHMAFNGTKHFEKQALVEYLESIGMRFGPDINAYTSFDETVYMLQVPTDSAEVLRQGFQILRDWAADVSFDDEEIDKERGVVIEEWRRSRGAGARIQDKQLPVILKGSRYADRLPIGNPDLLASFEHDALLRYYRDWYRPELMTVIAVGDFDASSVTELVRSMFGDIPAASEPRERFFADVPDHEDVLYSIVSDPEASSANVSILYKHEPWSQGSRSAYTRRLWSSLYSSMLNQRLQELTQSVNPPYIAAGSGESPLVRTASAYNLGALAMEGEYGRALEALLTEAERVRRFGFNASEFERVKTEYLRSMEIAFNERDKTESGRLAAELVRHVLTGESVPGIAYEYELARELVPAASLADVTRLVSSLVTEQNQVITMSGPDKEDQPLPDIDSVISVFEAVAAAELDPYEDDVAGEPLLADIPSPGDIVEEHVDESANVTFMTLSNGVKLVLKPTDFKNDQILIRATSPGGSSLADDEHYMSSLFASQLIGSSGAGSFGPIELEKKLAGKAVSLNPVVGTYSEGFTGSASPKDVETLFQLVYMFADRPRADSVVYASYMSRIASFLGAREASPQAAFSDTLSTTLARHHYRARPLSRELLDEIKLEDSFEFYRDRFRDFSDFTFYIVGAFNVESIRPYVRTYLGSLPAIERDETWVDRGIRTPETVVRKRVIKGLEPKSQVAIVFSGPAEWSIEERRRLSVMEEVLSTRLREILREDLGGTYSVAVNASLNEKPIESYRATITFGCAPDRVDELIGRVFDEVKALQASAPEETYVHNALETAVRQHEVGVRDNGFWLSSLQFYLEHGLDLSGIARGPSAWIDSIKASDVSDSARKYLEVNRFVQVILVPETGADS